MAAAAGRVYLAVAIVWLRVVDQVKPTVTDCVGVGLCFAGVAVIMGGARAGG